jgi:hypothetical protein
MFVVEHIDYFVVHLPEQLLGLYGRPEPGVPGPFSIRSYLKYMNRPGAWGDSVILWIISIMWGVGITVVDGESLDRTRIRHSMSMREANIVLVHASACHYIPAGN